MLGPKVVKEKPARTRAESTREYYEKRENREWPRALGMTKPPNYWGFIGIYITEKFSDSLFVVFSSGRSERI